LESATETIESVGRELIAVSLRAGYDVRVRVAGSSMVPALWPGDELMVRPLGTAEPARGDLLLFVRDGWLCTHRLIDRIDDGDVTRLITCGDAAVTCDPPQSSDQILGSVVLRFRNGHEVPVVASRPRKILSLAIRQSDFLRRVVLKIHALSFYSWKSTQTQRRA
jgi:signal peptidase I